MGRLRRESFLLLTGLLVGLSLIAFFGQRASTEVADEAARRTQLATTLLTSQLDHAIAVRQFTMTGDEAALTEASEARVAYLGAFGDERELAEGDPAIRRALAAVAASNGAWRAASRVTIDERRATGEERPASIAARNRALDVTLAAQARLRADLDVLRQRTQGRTERRTIIAMLAGTFLLAFVAYELIRRRLSHQLEGDARELAHNEGQHHLAEALAIVEDEVEAHDVLKRHLEIAAPGTRATVLNRNNSDNRLEATTQLPEGDPLVEAVSDAAPRDCMAVRRAQPHLRSGDDDAELLLCRLCSSCPGASACQPLVVGGKVIGSVLQETPAPLDALAERRLRESVEAAAPVLAHVRTLAIAEARASTDALTGLANRRAVHDSLKRMIAQASRSAAPLALVAVDLDHFKAINDRHGHDVGDEVLAAVGSVLRERAREADLVGRVGGEELVVIAPDTDAEGAVVLAEALRDALRNVRTLAGLDQPVTASFGVAALPEHAVDAEGLLRRADRALYLAKRNGRDRIELAGDAPLTARLGEAS